jgi:hypothetical protein
MLRLGRIVAGAIMAFLGLSLLYGEGVFPEYVGDTNILFRDAFLSVGLILTGSGLYMIAKGLFIRR